MTTLSIVLECNPRRAGMAAIDISDLLVFFTMCNVLLFRTKKMIKLSYSYENSEENNGW
jgi:hypothetical protein